MIVPSCKTPSVLGGRGMLGFRVNYGYGSAGIGIFSRCEGGIGCWANCGSEAGHEEIGRGDFVE